MTDEIRPDAGTEGAPTQGAPSEGTPSEVAPSEGAAPEAAVEGTATAVAAPETPGGGKLKQTVEIRDIGPCRKHIKVEVSREDIDARLGDHFSKLVADSAVPGFRPGKAPRKIIERRFRRDVVEQVRTEVLVASLEQVGEDYDVAPLAPPQLDPEAIVLPENGPLVYEFEVEVRPQFDLPEYRGMKLKRPTRDIGPDDVAQARRRLLSSDGQIIPKPEGDAQIGDVLVADVTVRDGDRVLGTIKEGQFTIEEQLAFKDGLARKFAEQVRGAKAGDTRLVDIVMSSAAADPALAGKTVQGTFEVKDLKTLRLPELNEAYLTQFGVANAEQLDELILVMLRRQFENQQRRSIRAQILERITAASSWELPRELLQRQARRALHRRIMEMKADGLTDQQILEQRRLLEQDILASTEVSLKEHFVLQKIAEVEKIEVNDDDLNAEIERLAEQSDESPRRVRARLEKEDMLEALAAEMIERRALDIILETAEYEDVPVDQKEEQAALASTEEQAVPGELRDPSAAPPEASAGEAGASAPESAQ